MNKIAKATIAVSLLGVTAFAEPTIYEAEKMEGLPSTATVVDSTGYSGGKYVNPGSTPLTFSIDIKETALYDIAVAVRIKQYDWTTSKILVNNVEVGSALTNPRNCDSNYVVSTIAKMKAGKNTVTVGNGAIGVDYLSIEKHPDLEFKISATPVTPGATPEAQKVYSFLVQNFGKKTLSGMMISDQNFNYDYANMKLIPPGGCTPQDSCKYSDEEVSWKGQTDIKTFYEYSGHYPAIGGFDMLFAAGGHSDEGWFKGYSENNLLMAKELWDMHGIPTFTWHWKVGEDTVFYTQNNGFRNAGCTEGVRGTAENNTCFDYRKAFKDSTCKDVDTGSKVYKDIVGDIDKVSALFQVLQDQNVPVLWRPLHEASGGWFWWGVASAECYVQLYRIVYDRMVKTNGLKNLIWVWNINTDPAFGYDYNALNAAWYPGDDYVDVVGVDIYDPLLDHNSAANYFNKIASDVGTSKLIALTENGAIPDIDSIAEDKSYWSYWMTWSQTWNGQFLDKTPKDMWKRNMEDERIVAIEDLPDWGSITTAYKNRARAVRDAGPFTLSANGTTLSVTAPTGNVNIAVYDMLGHFVVQLNRGILPKGTYSYSLESLAKGSYVIRAKAGAESRIEMLRVK